MKISGNTRICAIIGNPVRHSLSPFIHNAAFQHFGLDYVFLALTVRSENLEEAILGIRSLGFCGVTVTMPHKTDVIKYLDGLDETGKNAGSVNTILNKDGKLIGYTTDGLGTLNALRYNGVNPFGKKIVILGAGGASRSISFIIAKEVRELVIMNRTLKKAEKLVNDIACFLGNGLKISAKRLDHINTKQELREADILINATSLGMRPQETLTPVKANYLHSNLVVLDIVYEPIETRLLKEAKKMGAKTINGLATLVHQGAISFKIWTGASVPVEIMMEAVLKK
jgi:shikimate dehydrogenase